MIPSIYEDYYYGTPQRVPPPEPKNFKSRTYKILAQEVLSTGEIRECTFEQDSDSPTTAFTDAPGDGSRMRPVLIVPTKTFWTKFDRIEF